MKKSLVMVIIACILQCSDGSVENTDFEAAETRLIKTLISRVHPAARPVAKASEPVDVSFQMHLTTMIRLDTKEQTLITQGWLQKVWMDPQLSWNPDEYNNTQEIRLPEDKVWKPNIILFNNAADGYSFVYDKQVGVHHSGVVYWAPHVKLQSYCPINFWHFPFDTQTCSLVFTSWMNDISRIRITVKDVVHHNPVKEGPGWKLLDIATHTTNHTVTFGNSTQAVKRTYQIIAVSITASRHGMYHKNIFVIPAVFFAILTVFIFLIPPEAGERITLGIGILISLTLMIIVLDQYLPLEMGSIPIIGAFYTFDFVMTTFALVISIGILNLYHRDAQRSKVPTMLKKIFLGKLSKCLGVRVQYRELPSADPQTPESMRDILHVDDDGFGEVPLPRSPTLALEKTLDEIRRYLKICANKAQAVPAQQPLTNFQQMVIQEWRQVAMTIDRLLCLIFLVLTAICCLGFLA